MVKLPRFPFPDLVRQPGRQALNDALSIVLKAFFNQQELFLFNRVAGASAGKMERQNSTGLFCPDKPR